MRVKVTAYYRPEIVGSVVLCPLLPLEGNGQGGSRVLRLFVSAPEEMPSK